MRHGSTTRRISGSANLRPDCDCPTGRDSFLLAGADSGQPARQDGLGSAVRSHAQRSNPEAEALNQRRRDAGQVLVVKLVGRDDLPLAELVHCPRGKLGQESAHKRPVTESGLRPPCHAHAANWAFYGCGKIAQLLLRSSRYQQLPVAAQVHRLWLAGSASRGNASPRRPDWTPGQVDVRTEQLPHRPAAARGRKPRARLRAGTGPVHRPRQRTTTDQPTTNGEQCVPLTNWKRQLASRDDGANRNCS